jgi:iron complex transport system substrate-binding protein
MMRRLAWWSMLCWLWLAPIGSVRAAALSVVDDRGATVVLKQAPLRIVSLLPSLTEAVCDLGACDRLVGVDRWSNWPESVRKLPRAGGLDDPNVELIASLKPDLVLVAPSSRLATRLRSLGLVVAELDAKDLPEVQQVFKKIATLLGRPAMAEQRWQVLDAQINAAAALVPLKARGTRVYFEVGSTPYAASESSFIGQLLARLGVRNVVPASMGPFPKLNPEFVVRADPDLMVISKQDIDGLPQRPGWAGMRAVEHQRVCTLDTPQYDVLSRPGPRLGEAARWLAACLASKGAP